MKMEELLARKLLEEVGADIDGWSYKELHFDDFSITLNVYPSLPTPRLADIPTLRPVDVFEDEAPVEPTPVFNDTLFRTFVRIAEETEANNIPQPVDEERYPF